MLLLTVLKLLLFVDVAVDDNVVVDVGVDVGADVVANVDVDDSFGSCKVQCLLLSSF